MPFATCNHVKEDGIYCASPALRGRKYCYSHLMQRGRRLRRALAQSRNEPCALDIPALESLGSIRVALSEIVQALATGQLEYRTAGRMLYAVQQATTVTLRMAQMEAAASEHAKDAGQQAVADNSPRLEEYPEFERNFDIQPGIDLDAETDDARRRAEEQAAVMSIAPNPQPGGPCPVPAKDRYTREEAYQGLQWEIHLMRKQIREYHEEKKRQFKKMQPAPATPPLPGPLSSSA